MSNQYTYYTKLCCEYQGDITMGNFVKLHLEFEKAGFKPNVVSALSHFYNRMNLSIENGLYDEKQHAYYIRYSREELAKEINLDKSTITRIFKKLVAAGWIIIKQQFNASNKIFLPKFSLPKSHALQNETSKVAKCNSNKTYLTKTTKHNNKQVNTESVAENYAGESKLTQWIQSTNSVIGLTLSTLKVIKSFSKNKIDDCKHIVRIILNARNSVAKEHGVSKTAVTQFKSNKRLQDDLGKQLNHIFSYIQKRGYTSYYGYLTNSLKDYFKIAFGLAKPTKIVKPKGQNVRFSDHEPIKEDLPDWAKETPEERKNRRQKEDTMTLEEHEARKAELEAKLAMIRGKLA